MFGREEGPAGAGGAIRFAALAKAFNVNPCVRERHRPMTVEALVPQTSVEAFDVRILHPLPGLDKRRLDAGVVGPRIKRPTAKLGAVVERKAHGGAAVGDHPLNGSNDGVTRQTMRHGDREALVRAYIDDGERPNAAAVTQESPTKSMPHMSFGASAGGRGTRGVAADCDGACVRAVLRVDTNARRACSSPSAPRAAVASASVERPTADSPPRGRAAAHLRWAASARSECRRARSRARDARVARAPNAALSSCRSLPGARR